jgi:hypothetical protein
MNIYLAGGLVESKLLSKNFLADSIRSINLITKNEEWNCGKLLNRKKRLDSVKLACKYGGVD